MRVPDGKIPVVCWAVASAGGSDVAAKNIGVLPIVTEEEANFISDVLVNALQCLVC